MSYAFFAKVKTAKHVRSRCHETPLHSKIQSEWKKCLNRRRRRRERIDPENVVIHPYPYMYW